MIIDKVVRIKVNNRYLKLYESLGFGRLKQGDYIDLSIENLFKNSNAKVNVECDYCLNTFLKSYRLYNDVISRGGLYCCKSCAPEKYRETCLNKYGVTNTSKLSQTHEKIKSTNLKRYGVESFTKLESFKENHKLRMLEKYGVDSFSKTEEWLEKQKQTSLEKFGVENASQCPEIFSKQQKGRFEILQFRDTQLSHQGSFELDFLEKYYDKFEIIKGPIIEYEFGGSKRQYFSDFYLPQFNLIIEIKSTYTFELSKEKNIEKQKRCILIGYRHIFIIDKNYEEFLDITCKNN